MPAGVLSSFCSMHINRAIEELKETPLPELADAESCMEPSASPAATLICNNLLRTGTKTAPNLASSWCVGAQ